METQDSWIFYEIIQESNFSTELIMNYRCSFHWMMSHSFSKTLYFEVFAYVCVSVCRYIYKCWCPQRPEALDPLHLKLRSWTAWCGLGTACVLHFWAISPAQWWHHILERLQVLRNHDSVLQNISILSVFFLIFFLSFFDQQQYLVHS